MIRTSKGDFALKYTYNALAEFEDKTKIPFLEGVKKTSFAGIRDLVWAGLLHYHPVPGMAMSVQQVGELLEDAINTGADMVDIQEEIKKAVDDALFINRLAEKSVKRLAEKENRSGNKSRKWWQMPMMRGSTGKKSRK